MTRTPVEGELFVTVVDATLLVLFAFEHHRLPFLSPSLFSLSLSLSFAIFFFIDGQSTLAFFSQFLPIRVEEIYIEKNPEIGG